MVADELAAGLGGQVLVLRAAVGAWIEPQRHLLSASDQGITVECGLTVMSLVASS